MKVTDVRTRRKQLTALLFEDGSELLLDTELVIIKGIVPGVIIDDPDALIYESDLKRAKSRAMWYLSRGDHSEKGLCDKLKAAGFKEEACAAATARMKELGLINDEAYARRLAEYLSESGTSTREIYYKLVTKGIPSDIAKYVLEEIPADEVTKINKLLETKFSGKLDTEQGVQKTVAALQRKGFSFSDIREALKQYSENLENSEDY